MKEKIRVIIFTTLILCLSISNILSPDVYKRQIITSAAIISYIKGNLVLSVLAGILLSFLTINTLV